MNAEISETRMNAEISETKRARLLRFGVKLIPQKTVAPLGYWDLACRFELLRFGVQIPELLTQRKFVYSRVPRPL